MKKTRERYKIVSIVLFVLMGFILSGCSRKEIPEGISEEVYEKIWSANRPELISCIALMKGVPNSWLDKFSKYRNDTDSHSTIDALVVRLNAEFTKIAKNSTSS